MYFFNLMHVVTIHCIYIFTKYYKVKYLSYLPYYTRVSYRQNKVYGKTFISLLGIRSPHIPTTFKILNTKY